MIARLSSLLFIAVQTKTVRRSAEVGQSRNHSSLNMTSPNVKLKATKSTDSHWTVDLGTAGITCTEPPKEVLVERCEDVDIRTTCETHFERHEYKGYIWGKTVKYFQCKSEILII